MGIFMKLGFVCKSVYFFKTFISRWWWKLVIYNLIFSYLVTSLSWESYFMTEFRLLPFQSENIFAGRYFSSFKWVKGFWRQLWSIQDILLVPIRSLQRSSPCFMQELFEVPEATVKASGVSDGLRGPLSKNNIKHSFSKNAWLEKEWNEFMY